MKNLVNPVSLEKLVDQVNPVKPVYLVNVEKLVNLVTSVNQENVVNPLNLKILKNSKNLVNPEILTNLESFLERNEFYFELQSAVNVACRWSNFSGKCSIFEVAGKKKC